MTPDDLLRDALSKERRDHADSVRAFSESSRMKPSPSSDPRDYPFSGLGAFLGWMVGFAIWGGIAYVVLHFITKYW